MHCDCETDHTLNTEQSCDQSTGVCLCTEFWTGSRCDEDVNECEQTDRCTQPNQGCHNEAGGVQCSCYRGYEEQDDATCIECK